MINFFRKPKYIQLSTTGDDCCVIKISEIVSVHKKNINNRFSIEITCKNGVEFEGEQENISQQEEAFEEIKTFLINL